MIIVPSETGSMRDPDTFRLTNPRSTLPTTAYIYLLTPAEILHVYETYLSKSAAVLCSRMCNHVYTH